MKKFIKYIFVIFVISMVITGCKKTNKYALEFKQDIYRSANLSNIELPQFIKDQILHPIPFFTKIIYLITIVSFLAILGLKFFQFLYYLY